MHRCIKQVTAETCCEHRELCSGPCADKEGFVQQNQHNTAKQLKSNNNNKKEQGMVSPLELSSLETGVIQRC